MKVLVTGANGFVGSWLCDKLQGQGHQVVRVTRNHPCANPSHNHIEIGDIDEKTDWSGALQGVEVVIHTAARVHVLHESVTDPLSEFRHVNIDATVRLAEQAAEAGVRRFIFISTIGVLGNYSKTPMNEERRPSPPNAYSASKKEAEVRLMQVADRKGIEVVILRPPLVYGPGVKANFLRLMQAVDRGLPLPFGRVKNLRDFISVENLCSLVMLCLTHPDAANQIFVVADGEPISTPALIRKLAALLQKPARLLPVPRWFLWQGARLTNKERLYHSICSSLRIDTRRARNVLGWQPVQSMDEGLQQTVEWYKQQSHPPCDTPKERIAA